MSMRERVLAALAGGLLVSVAACGAPEDRTPQSDRGQAASATKADSPKSNKITEAEDASAEGDELAGAGSKAPQWVKQNRKRIDKIDETAHVTPKERKEIEQTWADERTEILRLIKTTRDSPNPDWSVVKGEVDALREHNDAELKKMLGQQRYDTYSKHRPRTSGGMPGKGKGKPKPKSKGKAPEDVKGQPG